MQVGYKVDKENFSLFSLLDCIEVRGGRGSIRWGEGSWEGWVAGLVGYEILKRLRYDQISFSLLEE